MKCLLFRVDALLPDLHWWPRLMEATFISQSLGLLCPGWATPSHSQKSSSKMIIKDHYAHAYFACTQEIDCIHCIHCMLSIYLQVTWSTTFQLQVHIWIRYGPVKTNLVINYLFNTKQFIRPRFNIKYETNIYS